MKISNPAFDELKEVYDIFLECRNALNHEGIFQWDDIYPGMDVISEDFKNNTIYIYRTQGEIAGSISFDEQQPIEYADIHWEHTGGNVLVIHRLAVHPKFQKQGIARELMTFTEKSALICGYSSIRLDVYSGNRRAVKFYEALGYKHRGEVYFSRRELPFNCMEKKL